MVWGSHPLPAFWSEAYIPFHHLLRPSMHLNAMAGALALLLPLGLAFLIYAWRRLSWVLASSSSFRVGSSTMVPACPSSSTIIPGGIAASAPTAP